MKTMIHCAMLQTSEIQAIIGDADRDGQGGREYCGVWSLTSKHRQFNAFGNSYAGLIPGEIRAKSPVLKMVDDRTCVLSRNADQTYPVDVRAEYRVSEPYYIDHTLLFIDKKDMRRKNCGFRETSWCCYMNCPDDPRLHFLSRGEWHHYISPGHGVAANIAPSYISDMELEEWPVKSCWRDKRLNDRPFHWDRYDRRFDEPFYYGRLGNMVLILIFDDPQRLRFFCSPSGGSKSLLPGQSCPAWDFQWLVPEQEYQVGKEYRFRIRLVYKQFISEDDILAEVRRAQKELGFRQVVELYSKEN